MTDEGYRRGYGVELRVRDMTPDEAARIAERLRAWKDDVRRQALRRTREIVYALPFAVAVVALAARRGEGSAWIGAAMIAFLFATIYFVARRHALSLAARSRGPWHAPPDGWNVREARVLARSIVTAVGDPEEHETWVLFEVPGNWFYVDLLCLPPSWTEARLARADVRLTRLWPDGVYLDVTTSGDAIPLRETTERFVPDESGADGCVEESTLPARIRG